jgi:hypothetical protein
MDSLIAENTAEDLGAEAKVFADFPKLLPSHVFNPFAALGASVP